ncbi:hypothetical protein HDV05_008781 [Chytridiales sp. JEL 0842]|nr:hypothetical protein HDV05_008781 [Chytridiales sp. JEL 0842]
MVQFKQRWIYDLAAAKMDYFDRGELIICHRGESQEASIAGNERGFKKVVISLNYESIHNFAIQSLEEMFKHPDNHNVLGVQPLHHFRTFAFNAICAFIGGADPHHQKLMVSLRPYFDLWNKGLMDTFSPEWMPYSDFNKAKKARVEMCNVLQTIISDRQRRMEAGQKFKDGLGMFMESTDENGQGFSPQELLDNLVNLLFAGFDTTSSLMTSVVDILLNSISADDLHILKEEVCDPELNLEDSDSELLKLPILDAFVKEALRTAAPVPGLFRKSTRDIDLDGTTIPSGTVFVFGLTTMLPIEDGHDTFRLSRFLEPESLDQKFPTHFNPFGFGQRHCLGHHLARLETKIITAELLRRFTFTQGTRATQRVFVPTDIRNPSVILRKK